jgi:hypothetical protein
MQNLVQNIALQSLQILYMFVLYVREIVTIFGSKMVTISAHNANIYKILRFQALQHFVTCTKSTYMHAPIAIVATNG